MAHARIAGRVQVGDRVELERCGPATVRRVLALGAVEVEADSGQWFRVSGLAFGYVVTEAGRAQLEGAGELARLTVGGRCCDHCGSPVRWPAAAETCGRCGAILPIGGQHAV